MNYQHAFHAGNFADVHKHAVLARILAYLQQKAGAFRVIDTHAGAGRYDLFAPNSSRGGEWHDGIERVWQAMPGLVSQTQARQVASQVALREFLAPYLGVVAALNPDSGEKPLRIYPGSPVIAQHLLRSQDRLIACELEPRAAAALKVALRGDARAKALTIDGWTALAAHLPPRERRGVVLIDPPFEEPNDFMRLSGAVEIAQRKWASGIFILWFPIKDRRAADALIKRLRKLAVPRLLHSEIMLGAPRADAGLIGSGLIVLNPPFKLDLELELILPQLGQILFREATCRVGWL
jgi:23S rRNA (adenine2030-N6)-methyltransferase